GGSSAVSTATGEQTRWRRPGLRGDRARARPSLLVAQPMAEGEEKRAEGVPMELSPPAQVPLKHPSSQKASPERRLDEASLQQTQLSLPGQEDEEDEEDEEEEPVEDEFDGVLDEDTVAEGLHKLGRSAPGIDYVYLHLSLPGRKLSDINILSKYVHLQKLELSYNKINDLSCISQMPYLLELNASNNELTTYFVFKPPKNLKVSCRKCILLGLSSRWFSK
uniref:Uncharacterized protein n=1 Tax=Nothoprocta perdicaria TaxID=30464 RepID=A0A8C6ZBG9_NOTPE